MPLLRLQSGCLARVDDAKTNLSHSAGKNHAARLGMTDTSAAPLSPSTAVTHTVRLGKSQTPPRAGVDRSGSDSD